MLLRLLDLFCFRFHAGNALGQLRRHIHLGSAGVQQPGGRIVGIGDLEHGRVYLVINVQRKMVAGGKGVARLLMQQVGRRAGDGVQAVVGGVQIGHGGQQAQV